MAEEQTELRRINWAEVFGFAQVFKSFRMAIHPSKLLLVLAAVVLIWLSGRALDGVWGVFGARAMPAGAARYATSSPQAFDRAWEKWSKTDRPEMVTSLRAGILGDMAELEVYQGKLSALGVSEQFRNAFNAKLLEENAKTKAPEPRSKEELLKEAHKSWSRQLEEAQDDFGRQIEKIDDLIEPAYKLAREKATDEEKKQLCRDRDLAVQSLTALKMDFNRAKRLVRGQGVISTFWGYQRHCLSKALSAVWQGNVLSGTGRFAEMRRQEQAPRGGAIRDALLLPFLEDVIASRLGAGATPGWLAEINAAYGAGNEELLAVQTPAQEAGLVYWLLMAAAGVQWLFAEHWLAAVIYVLAALAVWAVFGGAAYRIAALHAAREEKISIAQALSFSLGKFFGFFTAPLIPLGVIFLLGLVVMAGALVGNLWGVGAIIVGVLFFLALIVGLIIAFIVIGLGAGLSLMYPTIAVEGSDSFDAISRSFAYIYARPWRALLYALVAVFYGAFCYLFVRGFAYLTLAATHMFVTWGIWQGGAPMGVADKFQAMWTGPTFMNLHGTFNWLAMSWGEKIAAAFIWVYTGLVVAAVGAFLLSFFASASTVIYYLLRRKVDATDLDDVYVEEPQELAAPTEEGAAAEQQPSPQEQKPPEGQ